MLTIQPIPAFHDNYIWLLVHPQHRLACVVDPGDAAPVLAVLQQQQLTLAAILITHHHRDHCGGVPELVKKNKVPVYSPRRSAVAGSTYLLDDNDQFSVLDCSFEVMAIPGHTLDHIAFYDGKRLFCGDTLFTGGCGRVFEGTPAQMLNSLNRLKALPASTLVYCGHEYTEANLHFALEVEPDNVALQQRLQQVKASRALNLPSVPELLCVELETNPFLRCHLPTVRKAASQRSGRELSLNIDVFSVIRDWKNVF